MNLPFGEVARTGICPGPGVVERPRVRQRLVTAGARPALPTVAEGVAYLGDGDGHVCAIDLVGGGTLWQSRHELRHADGRPALSSVAALPAVAKDLVIAEAGEQIFAHDRLTGALRWSIPEISGHHAVVAGDAVLALHGLEAVAAYDLTTGARRWTSMETVAGLEHHYGYGLLASFAAVSGDRVFVTEGFEGNHTHGGLHAFNLDSGAPLWSSGGDFVACPHAGCEGDELTIAPYHPVYARGLVWVVRDRYCDGEGASALSLAGFDPLTGDERVALAEPQGMEIAEVFGSAPVFGPELIYCASRDTIHALEPGDGRVRWSRGFPAPVVATPLLAGGILHLATEGGGLHAVDEVTGEPRWDLTLDEPTTWTSTPSGEYDEVSPPFTLAGGELYAVTDTAVLALS